MEVLWFMDIFKWDAGGLNCLSNYEIVGKL